MALSIAQTAGVQLIAALLGVAFYGGLVVVAVDYWQKFPNDRWYYRVLVVAMMILATADTIVNCAEVYNTLISNFADAAAIDRRTWMFCALFPFIGVTCALLQSFLVYRIYIVSAKRWRVIPAVTMMLTLSGASISLWVAAWLPTQPNASDLEKRVYMVWTWYACHAVSDLLTTGSLLYFLVWQPWRNGGGASRSVTLRRVVMRSVESNALSLVWQTWVMITFATADSIGYVFTLPAYTLVKIYAYSLLSALNTRASSAGEDVHSSGNAIASYGGGGAGTTYRRSNAPFGGRKENKSRFDDVQVTVVHDIEVDDFSEAPSYKMQSLEEGIEPVRVNFASRPSEPQTKEDRVRALGLPQDKF